MLVKKTAERLIIELRDRFEKTALGSSTITSADTPTVSYRADALAALEALGLSRSGAEKAILTVLRTNPDISSAEELIRLALRA